MAAGFLTFCATTGQAAAQTIGQTPTQTTTQTTPQSRAPLSLQKPVDCTLGQSCWLVNYPDTDAANDVARDYQCGPLTYEGHDGTDFGIRDLVAMEMGVDVKAAAAGKVHRLRDGAEDTMPDAQALAALHKEKKACGNGIVINHEQGYQTFYCHLKKDSIKVKEGQSVKAGTPLAQIGHSGAAEFPHLHFMVMKDGKTLDPFTGTAPGAACKRTYTAQNANATENTPGSLWATPLPYEPVAIYAGGFRAAVPDLEALRIDATAPVRLRQSDTRILSFWAILFGVAAGDLIELEIQGPDGGIIAQKEIIQDKNRARQFYYIGKDYKSTVAASGVYTGVVTLSRQDPDGKTTIRTFDTTVTVQ